MASGNRTDISLDDPNFWDKWAKKADIDMEMVNGRVSSPPHLIQSTKRRINLWKCGKPFADVLYVHNSLFTEQLGDRHTSCPKADEAVQRHQG